MLSHKMRYSHCTATTVGWLYAVALLLHSAWLAYIHLAERPPIVIVELSRWLVLSYESIGFAWTLNDGTQLITAGILSATLVNTFRHIVQVAITGWPKPSHGDLPASTYLISRAIGFCLLIVLGLGAWGTNLTNNLSALAMLSKQPTILDGIDFAFILIGTFLLGNFAGIINDAISSVVISIRKEP